MVCKHGALGQDGGVGVLLGAGQLGGVVLLTDTITRQWGGLLGLYPTSNYCETVPATQRRAGPHDLSRQVKKC